MTDPPSKINFSAIIKNISEYICSALSYCCVIFTSVVLLLLFFTVWASVDHCERMQEDFTATLPNGTYIIMLCDQKPETKEEDHSNDNIIDQKLDWYFFGLDNFKFYTQR